MKRTQVRDLFDELTMLAEKELKRSGEFQLPGMVKLVLQKRKARTGRNPATGEEISIPAKTAQLIRSKIEQYADDPASLANNVKRLQGRDGYRLRIGNYRVLFDQDGVVLTIQRVGPRGSIYED